MRGPDDLTRPLQPPDANAPPRPLPRLVRHDLTLAPVPGPVGGPLHSPGPGVTTLQPPEALASFVDRHRHLLVLTGAGMSTAAGIPDYRDADGRWKGASPMSWQAFSGSAAARRRYWARSLLGWPRIAAAEPTLAHRALARLEARGRCRLLVTQNVDRLHQKAGSREVVDLHGRLDRVICLDCGRHEARDSYQSRLLAANQGWPWLPMAEAMATDQPGNAPVAAARPDGDADLDALDAIDYDRFDVPACQDCDGVLKPDVVFFGDSVPRDRVDQVNAALDEADGVLIVGTSLTVFSGWRFARDAAARGLPLAAVNLGSTRADPLLTLKIVASADTALAFLQ